MRCGTGQNHKGHYFVTENKWLIRHQKFGYKGIKTFFMKLGLYKQKKKGFCQ